MTTFNGRGRLPELHELCAASLVYRWLVSTDSGVNVPTASVSEALVSAAALSTDAVPYLLPTLDAAAIILASVLGGICYQLSAGYFFPDLRPYLAVGLFASFIHVLRLRGRGYYQVSNSAKPGVEIGEVLL